MTQETQTYCWSAAAAVVAVAMEYFFRRGQWTWWQMAPFLLLPAMFVNYAVYRVLRGSENLLTGFIVWSMASVASRTFVSLVLLRERVSKGSWAAFALLLAAQVVKKLWR
jgi:multidrug transporter EmrE-like cation transporter